MARPLRIQKINYIYYVTNICIQQEFLFIPTAKVIAIIRGALARAAMIHMVEIYAFTVALNSFDMMLGAPELNLPEFMKSFQGELATALNKYLGREGKFFEARYDKSDLLDNDAILEKFKEITCRPIEAGLVRTLEDYKGVCSWDNYQSGEVFRGKRINRTEYRKLLRKSQNVRDVYQMPKDAGLEHFEFKLHRLPGFEHQSDEEHRAHMKTLIDAHAAGIRLRNKEKGVKYLGMDKIMTLKWRHRPDAYQHRHYQMCYGSAALRDQYKLDYQAIAKEYAEGMRAYIEEDDASKFPTYSCRPGVFACEKPGDWVRRW